METWWDRRDASRARKTREVEEERTRQLHKAAAEKKVFAVDNCSTLLSVPCCPVAITLRLLRLASWTHATSDA